MARHAHLYYTTRLSYPNCLPASARRIVDHSFVTGSAMRVATAMTLLPVRRHFLAAIIVTIASSRIDGGGHRPLGSFTYSVRSCRRSAQATHSVTGGDDGGFGFN